MNPSANRITPEAAALEIFQERFPNAKVIFLAGSIIRGEGTEHSDLDIVVIYEKIPNAYRDSFIHKGWPVEVFVHDPETLNYFFLELDRPSGTPTLPNMVVEGLEIPHPCELSASLKSLARSVIDAGPPAWTERDLIKARYMITDYCDDMRSPRNPQELTATAVRLYEALANFYCRAQGVWSAKGKSIPRRLKHLDPKLALRFTSSFDAVFVRQDPQSLLTLAGELLTPYGGFLFENSRADAPVGWRRPCPPQAQRKL